MIASLPMYDWPELQKSNDALWERLAAALVESGIDAPPTLTRSDGDESHWLSPQLLLGQTCGYPFATLLKDKVKYVTTPTHRVTGCRDGFYSSAYVVHKDSDLNRDNLKGAGIAFTSTMSWSGYRTIIRDFGPLEDYFGTMVKSGGHRQSARLVAAGTVQVTALDAVCWHFLQQFEPRCAQSLKVIAWSSLQPALPLITSPKTSPKNVVTLRSVIERVLEDPKNNDLCEILALKGCKTLVPSDYNHLANI